MNEICITHIAPLANIEKKIYLNQYEIPIENIILLRNNDTIYLLPKVSMQHYNKKNLFMFRFFLIVFNINYIIIRFLTNYFP